MSSTASTKCFSGAIWRGRSTRSLSRSSVTMSRAPVFLIPLDRPALQQQMYAWGAKNLEIHFAQVRGAYTPMRGVVMPTFMPETA